MASHETISAAELLARTRDGVLLYGLTPPRATTTAEQADAVAEAALTRLRSVQVDGLILYDVDAEANAGAEHQRMLRKQDAGCEFFVSQVCYDLDHTRNLLSDYAYSCRDHGLDPRPVVLTLAPCGSAKTLEFMSWLGIDVPGWLRTEITRSGDPLTASYEQCVVNARILIAFCRRLDLPFGINVESLTNRKVEIDASIDLAREIRSQLD